MSCTAPDQLGASLRAALELPRFLGRRESQIERVRSDGESPTAQRIDRRGCADRRARNAARKAKEFAEADRIRDELAAMGIDAEGRQGPQDRRAGHHLGGRAMKSECRSAHASCIKLGARVRAAALHSFGVV